MVTLNEAKEILGIFGFNEDEIQLQRYIIKDLGLDSTEQTLLRSNLIKKYKVDFLFDKDITVEQFIDLLNSKI